MTKINLSRPRDNQSRETVELAPVTKSQVSVRQGAEIDNNWKSVLFCIVMWNPLFRSLTCLYSHIKNKYVKVAGHLPWSDLVKHYCFRLSLHINMMDASYGIFLVLLSRVININTFPGVVMVCVVLVLTFII